MFSSQGQWIYMVGAHRHILTRILNFYLIRYFLDINTFDDMYQHYFMILFVIIYMEYLCHTWYTCTWQTHQSLGNFTVGIHYRKSSGWRDHILFFCHDQVFCRDSQLHSSGIKSITYQWWIPVLQKSLFQMSLQNEAHAHYSFPSCHKWSKLALIVQFCMCHLKPFAVKCRKPQPMDTDNPVNC